MACQGMGARAAPMLCITTRCVSSRAEPYALLLQGTTVQYGGQVHQAQQQPAATLQQRPLQPLQAVAPTHFHQPVQQVQQVQAAAGQPQMLAAAQRQQQQQQQQQQPLQQMMPPGAMMGQAAGK